MSRDATFEQLPLLISEGQLLNEIRELSESISPIFCPEINWADSENNVTTTPAKMVCFNIPDGVTNEDIQAVITSHVPDIV